MTGNILAAERSHIEKSMAKLLNRLWQPTIKRIPAGSVKKCGYMQLFLLNMEMRLLHEAAGVKLHSIWCTVYKSPGTPNSAVEFFHHLTKVLPRVPTLLSILQCAFYTTVLIGCITKTGELRTCPIKRRKYNHHLRYCFRKWFKNHH